jgi:hypothetical protein
LEASRIPQLNVRTEQLLNGVAWTHLARVTPAQDVVEGFEGAGHLEIGELCAESLPE